MVALAVNAWHQPRRARFIGAVGCMPGYAAPSTSEIMDDRIRRKSTDTATCMREIHLLEGSWTSLGCGPAGAGPPN